MSTINPHQQSFGLSQQQGARPEPPLPPKDSASHLDITCLPMKQTPANPATHAIQPTSNAIRNGPILSSTDLGSPSPQLINQVPKVGPLHPEARIGSGMEIDGEGRELRPSSMLSYLKSLGVKKQVKISKTWSRSATVEFGIGRDGKTDTGVVGEVDVEAGKGDGPPEPGVVGDLENRRNLDFPTERPKSFYIDPPTLEIYYQMPLTPRPNTAIPLPSIPITNQGSRQDRSHAHGDGDIQGDDQVRLGR